MDNVVLKTERLVLRPYSSTADAPFIRTLERRREVKQFIGGLSAPVSTARLSITGRTEETSTVFIIHCERRKIGIVGLVRCDVEDGQDVQIVCALRKSAEGSGFAREACERVLEWAFVGKSLPRVLGLVHKDNTRSAKLVRSLGMEELRPRPYSDETVFVAHQSKQTQYQRREGPGCGATEPNTTNVKPTG